VTSLVVILAHTYAKTCKDVYFSLKACLNQLPFALLQSTFLDSDDKNLLVRLPPSVFRNCVPVLRLLLGFPARILEAGQWIVF